MNENNTFFQEAKHLFATGDPNASIELFSKAEAMGCNPVNIGLSRGAAYLAMHEFAKAIADFNQVLAIDPDNERALYFRGIAHLNLAHFRETVEDLSKSIALNHARGTAFLARALAHNELGHTEEALQDLKTTISYSSQEVERFLNEYGSSRTLFEKSKALFEGERGPWSTVMTETEANKMNKWLH